jgi:hypothetical protein
MPQPESMPGTRQSGYLNALTSDSTQLKTFLPPGLESRYRAQGRRRRWIWCSAAANIEMKLPYRGEKMGELPQADAAW